MTDAVLDMRVEDSSVEYMLRRVQQCLRPKHPAAVEAPDVPAFEPAAQPPFENLHLDPEIFAALDYAGKSYDPRMVPANTRLYRFKSMLARLMRVYTTRQVEFNAAMVRVSNRFFDLFHDVLRMFDYLHRAHVNLTHRLEHTEQVLGNIQQRLDHQRQRVENVEDMEQELNIQRRRIEHIERYEQDIYLHQTRLERLEGWEKELNSQRARIEGLERWDWEFGGLRTRVETLEHWEKKFNQMRDRIERIEPWDERINKQRERIEALEEWEQDFNALRDRIEHVECYEQDLYRQRIRFESIEERERKFDERLRVVEPLEKRLEHALAENIVLRQRLDRIMLDIEQGRVGATTSVVGMLDGVARDLAAPVNKRESMLNDHLYFPYLNEDRAIEDVIRDRVKEYLPFFAQQKVSKRMTNDFVLDVGCGRGEFLDVCRTRKLPCRGVDINEDMVKHCRTKQHTVERGDANAYLSTLDDDSLRGLISCHVIEHMPSSEVLAFLKLCWMKLAVGGRLVIETPNPQSLFGISLFFRDFTHERPVHPQTLKFLLGKLGFSNITIKDLHPAPDNLALGIYHDPVDQQNMGKIDTHIYGCLDYALFAIK